MASLVLERRKQPNNTRVDKRQPWPAGHSVHVGTTPERPDWIVGMCECGEVAESKADGLVEAWAIWHRTQVAHSK